MSEQPSAETTGQFRVDEHGVLRSAEGQGVGFVFRCGRRHQFVPGFRPGDWDAESLFEVAALLEGLDVTARLALVESSETSPEAPASEPEQFEPEQFEPEQSEETVAPQPAFVTPLDLSRVVGTAPLHATPPLHKRPEDGVRVDGVYITGRVVETAHRFGHSLEALAAAATNPDRSWSGTAGTTCCRRGNLMVIVGDDTGDVIAMNDQRNNPYVAPGDGMPKAKSGGPGNRIPHDTPTLLARLHDLGFEVDKTRPHYHVTHPDHPGKHSTMPKTPSDHRSYANTCAQIRGIFGVDLRDGSWHKTEQG